MPRERIYGDAHSSADLLLDWTKATGDPPNTHWAFCLLATRLIQPKVETLLFDLGLD